MTGGCGANAPSDNSAELSWRILAGSKDPMLRECYSAGTIFVQPGTNRPRDLNDDRTAGWAATLTPDLDIDAAIDLRETIRRTFDFLGFRPVSQDFQTKSTPGFAGMQFSRYLQIDANRFCPQFYC